MTRTVPNLFPIVKDPRRLAIIGEAPGKDEVEAGVPFIGASGRFLAALLSKAGIIRDACFLGNISQHRPDGNDITKFQWSGAEIQYGLEQLRKDIATFDPHMVVLLGNVPMKAAKDVGYGQPLKRYRFPVSSWRGSLFKVEDALSPFYNRKCLASYHPSACLRDQTMTPFLMFDLRKAVAQSSDPVLRLPHRELLIPESAAQCLQWLDEVHKARKIIAIDIEGYVDSMSCISIATSPERAFIVPFTKISHERYWKDRNDEQRIWLALSTLLEDPLVPKVLQNCLYDAFVLDWSYHITVRGIVDDIMLKHWELYSDLGKDDRKKRGRKGLGLAIQASLYTDEPYWKELRESEDDKTFYEYCCRDSAVTLEINEKLSTFLPEQSRRQNARDCNIKHYRFNMDCLIPLRYMMRRGILYDSLGAAARRQVLRDQMHELQAKLNALTNHCLEWKNPGELFYRAREVAGYKRATITSWDELKRNCKKDYLGMVEDLCRLSSQPLTLASIGEIENLLEVSLNIDSAKTFQPFLYETLKLPVQTKENAEGELRPSSDYESLLKLSRELQQGNKNDPRLAVIHTAIELRALRTREGMLSISADYDGRIRCGYNLVGSNTGRITSYESPTGSGYNLQTIPNYTSVKEAPGGILGDRDLFLADVGYYLFQCDLSGADGWTVAAYSALLGDNTMLLDYQAGVSPFKILTLMLRGLKVPEDRKDLREAVKVIGKDDWDRFACKRVQHGGCLTSGHEVLTRQGWKDISCVGDWDEIMVADPGKGTCHFERPSKWTRKAYTGNMVKAEGTAFSIYCTEDHRIPFEDNGDKECLAYQIVKKKSGRIPYSAHYMQGKTKEPLAALCAAYHADGCLNHKTETMNFHFKKERKVLRLLQIINAAGLEQRTYNQADGSTIIDVKIKPPWPKKPGAYQLEWDHQSLKTYLDEIEHWDGHRTKNGCVRFDSVDKATIGWVQTFCHLTGQGSVYQGTQISGFGSMMHRMSKNARKYAWIDSLDRSVIPVNDISVFCPTVSTGFFLYRHNDKIAITGNSYLEGALTVSRNIFKDSEGKLYLSVKECQQMLDYYFQRYRGVRYWHNWVSRKLRERPVLIAASGQVRQFFGHPDEILTKAVAFEPQSNTTYATNLAMHRLWNDPDNRIQNSIGRQELSQTDNLRARSSQLRIEPLHQVHDALIGQFKIEDTSWATGKIVSYFSNPLLIANQNITIPFEGSYGKNWAMSHDLGCPGGKKCPCGQSERNIG